MRRESLNGRNWRANWAVAALLFLASAAVGAVPLVRSLQLRLNDSYFSVGPAPRRPSPVMMVVIDDQSLAEYGRWPWSRTLLAQLTRNLSQAGAQVIGLDILLSEPQTPAADAALRDALAESGRVVLVDKIGTFPEGPRWIEPAPQLARAAAAVGHSLAVLDRDGVCRRYPPLELSPDGSRWAFALEVARRIDPARLAGFLAEYEVPAKDEETAVTMVRPVLIPIAYRSDAFTTLSALEALQGKGLNAVRGRPVLVGFGPTEINDRLNTPLSKELPTAGVAVHAQILDAVLAGRRLHESPLWLDGLLLAGLSLAVVVAFRRYRGWVAVALVVAFVSSVYAAGLLAFVVGRSVIAVGPLMVAVVAGPLLVHCADFVLVEHSLTRQFRELSRWLASRRPQAIERKHDLAWRLGVLRQLQQELGSLYELHVTLLQATDSLIGIFNHRGELLLSNTRFDALFSQGTGARMTLKAVRERMVPNEGESLAVGTALEREAYVGEELYLVRVMPFPPTTLAPGGGTIISLSNLKARVERDRARAEALGFITHELRTPLVSIQGFAEFMLKFPEAPDTARAPEVIFRESKRLLALINGYLDVLRLDAGARALREQPLDIAAVVRQVFDVLQPLAASVGMRFTFRAGAVPELVGDVNLVSGAVLNLVSNALKYGRRGSEVLVSAGVEDEQVVLGVHNEGETIAPEDLGRVFDAYYRASCMEGAKPGWGLGLAFVRRIAEKHGGTVNVRSEAGRTCFELRLPARPVAVAARTTA
ncbi:MAG: CHASE2 domain-containing protein [Terriglobales bacterium]